jgi:GTP1/Obg family GTP-binding protein
MIDINYEIDEIICNAFRQCPYGSGGLRISPYNIRAIEEFAESSGGRIHSSQLHSNLLPKIEINHKLLHAVAEEVKTENLSRNFNGFLFDLHELHNNFILGELKKSDDIPERLEKGIESIFGKSTASDLKRRIDEISSTSIRIVVAGLLKAGKSTMLNALTGHYDNCFFPVGIIRTTTDKQEYCFDDITYIDTPGIDAEEGDEEKAFQALGDSDMFIFTHNMNSSELDCYEIEFLKKLNTINKGSLNEKMITVLTNLDKIGKEGVSKIKRKITLQMSEIINWNGPVISVSSTRYQKGKMEDKQLLEKSSGYEQLFSSLAEMKKKVASTIMESRSLVISGKITSMIKEVEFELESLKSMKNKLQCIYEEREREYNTIAEEANRLLDITFKNYLTQLLREDI